MVREILALALMGVGFVSLIAHFIQTGRRAAAVQSRRRQGWHDRS